MRTLAASLLTLTVVALVGAGGGCDRKPLDVDGAANAAASLAVAPVKAEPNDIVTTSVAAPPATDAVADGTDEGGCGAHADGAADTGVRAAFDEAPKHGEHALCLVMNRKFVVDEKTVTSTHDGKVYAFCCDGCKQAFDENPAKYLTASAAPSTTPPAKPGT